MIKKYLTIFNLILVLITFFGNSRATVNTEDFPSKLTEGLPDATKLASVPHNEALYDLINSLKQMLQEQKQNSQLDDKTKKLLTTVQRIMDSTKGFIEDKNYDEAIQKFIAHASKISSMIVEETKGKTGKIKEDLQQYSLIVPKIKNFVSNLITAGEFRRLIWSVIHAFSDVFSRVVAKTSSNADQIRDSAQNLKDSVKRTANEGAEGVNEFAHGFKKSADKIAQNQGSLDELKASAQKTVEEDGENGLDDLKNAAKKTAQQGVQAASEAYDDVKRNFQRAHDKKADDVKEGVEEAKNNAKDLKDKVQTTAQQGYQIARDEGRKLFLERIQPLLYKITTHREYQEAASEIQDLFNYFRNLKDNEEVTSISPQLRQELRSFSDEGTELVSRFTRGRNIQRTKDAFWKLYNDMSIDKETSQYFSDLSSVLQDITKNPTKYQKFSNVKNTFVDLYDRGTTIVQQKYGDRFYEFSSEINDIFEDFSNENLSPDVRKGLRLAADIVTSSPFHALSQLRELATPYLKNFTSQIKLPPIEGKQQDTYYKVENIIFQVDESKFEDIMLHITVGLKEKIIVELRLTDLDLTFKDVHFHYENPKYLTDNGIMDVHVKFPSWFLRWGLEDSNSLFGDSTVEVQLDTLDVTIQQADHKIVDKVLLSLFSSWIKEKVRSAIETALREPANTIAQQFNNFFFQNKELLQQQFLYSEPWASSTSYLPQFFRTAA